MKCTEETRLPGYPECASDDEIHDFLLRRRAFFKIITEQVDFNDRSDIAIRENEIYTPSVPIQPGFFGDFGARFRYNKFERED